MKHLLLKSLLLALCLLTTLPSLAYDVEVDGIYYDLDRNNHTASVTYRFESGNDYSGTIVIPSSITLSETTYQVTSIYERAFQNCYSLTSVTIPEGVTSIGSEAFYGCSSLTSITIPEGVTSIGGYAFRYCYSLTSITIPESVTTIDNDAFYDTAWLNNQPDGVVYAGSVAYKYKGTMPANTEIVLKNGIASISPYAFYGCSSLTSITIPEGVTSIGSSAFYGCSSLIVKVPVSDLAAFCNNRIIPLIRERIGRPVTLLDSNGNIITEYIIPASVTSIGNYAFYRCSSLTSITIPESVTSIGNDAFVGCRSLSTITVDPNNVIYDSREGCNAIIETQTNTLIAGCSNTIIPNNVTSIGANAFGSSGLTSVTIPSSVTSIGSSAFDSETPLYIHRGTPALLALWQSASYSPYSEFPNISIYDVETNEKIYTWLTATASSVRIYDFEPVEGYTKLSETFKVGGTAYNEHVIKGLDSGTLRNIIWTIQLQNKDGKSFSYEIKAGVNGTITVPAIQLTTLQPKVISAGNVIVSAKSNIDDEEEKVGFEWRRTDWTDDFESNSGGAYLFEGAMEGYIRNLYAEKLWKYRPYYESNSGNRYYGEWVGIDPTNTSYFEPTVHTYASIQTEGNAAQVRGYVQRGSDNVAQQGFAYWKLENEVKAAAIGSEVNVPRDAKTVEAKGTVMEAELTALDYESTYCVVAFVTTTEGETFYGETLMFSTGINPDGIEDIKGNEANSATVVIARYDLNGRRLATPQRGINLLRMSDGTVRKVLVK